MALTITGNAATGHYLRRYRPAPAGGARLPPRLTLAFAMELDMSQHADLIDRYIAVWNETDGARRRALIARTFTENASYLDPLMAGDGCAAIDGMIAAVQQRFPGYRFRRRGEVDSHHDRIRFAWELAPEGGPVFADGTDFGIVSDGRLRSVTGFLDHQPGAAG